MKASHVCYIVFKSHLILDYTQLHHQIKSVTFGVLEKLEHFFYNVFARKPCVYGIGNVVEIEIELCNKNFIICDFTKKLQLRMLTL